MCHQIYLFGMISLIPRMVLQIGFFFCKLPSYAPELMSAGHFKRKFTRETRYA